MAGSFFTGWKLWEQLTFCLACGLVVAIGIGLLKLTYTSWRLRKYSALEKLARRTSLLREKSIIRSLSKKPKLPPKRQAPANLTSKPAQRPDVFFGIKALEKGAIVEGVWTSSKTSLASQLNAESNVYARLPDLEAQAQANPSPRPKTANLEGIPAVPPLPSIDTKSSRAPSPALTSRAYPPPSFMRYTSDDFKPSDRRSSSRNSKTRESYRPTRSTSKVVHQQSSDQPSPQSNVRRHSSQRLPVSRDSSANSIQLIDAHRASLCAETGQILPRFRSTSISHASDDRDVDINDDEPTLVNDVTSGDISDAAFHALPRSFSQTVVASQAAPASGLQMAEAAVTTAQAALHRKPSSIQVENTGDPKVLRQVNPGFAILRPGTLNVADRSVSQEVGTAQLSSRSRSTSSTRRRKWRQSLERRLSRSSSTGQGPQRSLSWGQKLQKRQPSDGQQMIRKPST